MKNTFNQLKWMLLVSASAYFLQGIEGLPGQAFLVYMKNVLKLDASQVMWIASIITLAWVIKPIFAFFIDKFSIPKKTWIIGASLVGVLICFLLSLGHLPLVLVIGLMMLLSTTAAIRDISVDGVMCVEGKRTKWTGKIQAIQWISITLAGIVVGLVGGEVAHQFSYGVGYLALIPLLVLCVLPALFMKTPKRNDKKPSWKKYLKLLTDKKFVLLCIFLFLYKFSPSFGTPLAYMQRDVFNWSERFIGQLSAIVSVMEIIGAIIYFKYCRKLDIGKWLYASVFLGGVTTLAYLFYTPYTALVYGILFAVIGMFVHLITMDFMARNSIKGMETTSFALLCSVSNLASTASSMSGAFLLPKLGLPTLIIVSSLASFSCLFLIRKVFSK